MFDDAEPDDIPVSGGLNAGAELDEEDLFEEPVAGEVPELREDLTIYVALEAQLQDLAYLQHDIQEAHGMCKSFAMEAERIVPGLTGVPLGFFTEAPTATRLKVSLESLSKTVWVLIGAAIGALIASIARFTGWWKAGKGGAKDSAQAARDNESTLREQEGVARDMASVVNGGAALLDEDGKPIKKITMASLVEDLWGDNPGRYERTKAFLALENPFHRDIIQRGTYTQTFRAITPALGALTDLLRQKLALLDVIAATDKNSFTNMQKGLNTRALEAVSEPVTIRFMGGNYTLHDAAGVLSRLRADTNGESRTGKTPMQVDQMVTAVSEAYRASEVEKFFFAQREIIEVFDGMDKALEKLKRTAGDLSTDGQANHNTEGVASHLREVIFKVAKDITGYNLLFAELRHYGMGLEALANHALGIAQEIEKQLMALAQRKKIKLPREWNDRSAIRSQARVDALFGRTKAGH